MVVGFFDSIAKAIGDVFVMALGWFCGDLVLMPRESPLHKGHCKLLYEAADLGAVIAPPMPAFYNTPETIDDQINHSVGRVLDLFDVDPGVVKRWQGNRTSVTNDPSRPSVNKSS